ncbi:uncharacterized protein LOC119676811 [Teleopsis dalmanni]|uniref:uncharacterized protein LOC119676811 n=1 Tax=Teleopsis dalmanni TaxID=139649 RepID=UPI0018CECF76|nr:uncharacterized protein LOC119676811 [Teleopsis dalmanni]
MKVTYSQPYKQQRCSNRLENALEHMRRRNIQIPASRSMNYEYQETPYTLYYSLYGQQSDSEDDFYSGGSARGYFTKNINRNINDPFDFEAISNSPRQPHKLSVSRVDVEDLRVKLPSKVANHWVEIDKCKFSAENSTLDTRLIFPDLTLSGKIVLQPTGGKCQMILRLRHAGIEFRTIPIGFNVANNEESRRMGSASVRTDSHFAEPGFISVFAHGCQGPTGIRLRQNSKRRFGVVGEHHTTSSAPEIELSEPQVIMGIDNNKRWGKFHNPYNPIYDIRSTNYGQKNLRDQELLWNNNENDSHEPYTVDGDNFYRRHFRYKRGASEPFRSFNVPMGDKVNFSADILNFGDDLQELVQPDARAFAQLFNNNNDGRGLYPTNFGEGNEIDEALTSELEKLFSMGVRSLLTTYMQRALQPAIKETLMENMGYTLSYG